MPLIPLIPLLACELPSKVCIGDCGDESTVDTSDGAPDTGTTSDELITVTMVPTTTTTTATTTGDADEGSSSSEPDSSTTGMDSSTGEPVDVCTIVDNFSRSASCFDNVQDAGEFCLGAGFGSPFLPPAIVSFVAEPVDALGGTDLLMSHGDRTISWSSLGDAKGTWPLVFPEDTLILTGTGDFDEDGNFDVIGRRVGGAGDTVEIVFTDGTGQPLGTHSVPLDTIGFGPEAVDWNDDGHLDLVVIAATVDSPVTRIVLEGDGAGAFTVVPQFDLVGPFPGLHAVGALDADEVPDDFVVADSANRIGVKSGNDHALTNVAFGPDAVVHALAIRDLDGDGLGDIVALVEDTAGGGTSLSVALQTDELLVFAATAFPVRCGATALALGDLDQDGALDLVVGGPGEDPMLTIRRGDGQGDFSSVIRVELAPLDVLRIADFTGDGAIDIASVNHAKGTLSVAMSSP